VVAVFHHIHRDKNCDVVVWEVRERQDACQDKEPVFAGTATVIVDTP